MADVAAAAQSKSGPSWVTSRPRLYFDAKEVERIRRVSASDGEFKRRWEAVLESAKRMLGARLIPEIESRAALRRDRPVPVEIIPWRLDPDFL
jgi:hypothetical protein